MQLLFWVLFFVLLQFDENLSVIPKRLWDCFCSRCDPRRAIGEKKFCCMQLPHPFDYRGSEHGGLCRVGRIRACFC